MSLTPNIIKDLTTKHNNIASYSNDTYEPHHIILTIPGQKLQQKKKFVSLEMLPTFCKMEQMEEPLP